jgi:hypothetical protein
MARLRLRCALQHKRRSSVAVGFVVLVIMVSTTSCSAHHQVALQTTVTTAPAGSTTTNGAVTTTTLASTTTEPSDSTTIAVTTTLTPTTAAPTTTTPTTTTPPTCGSPTELTGQLIADLASQAPDTSGCSSPEAEDDLENINPVISSGPATCSPEPQVGPPNVTVDNCFGPVAGGFILAEIYTDNATGSNQAVSVSGNQSGTCGGWEPGSGGEELVEDVEAVVAVEGGGL